MKSSAAKHLIHEFLSKHPLGVLETRIKQAAIAHLLGSELARDYHAQALSVGYWDFVRNFRQIFADHRDNSDALCEILAHEETPAPSMLKELLSKALKLDAAITGYTRSLNDHSGLPGRYTTMRNRVSKLSKVVGLTEEESQFLFTPFYFDSFYLVLTRDVFSLLSDRNHLPNFADTYTHGIPAIAEQVSVDFSWLNEANLHALADNRRQSRENYRQVRDKFMKFTPAASEFEEMEIEIQGLLYIDNYVEEKGRFALADGIGDVILRHIVAERLFNHKLLASPDPFTVLQTELLVLLKQLAVGGKVIWKL